MEPEVGDKVKLKATWDTRRGVVEEVHGDELLIRLHETGNLFLLRPNQSPISAWLHVKPGRTCHIGKLVARRGHVIATEFP